MGLHERKSVHDVAVCGGPLLVRSDRQVECGASQQCVERGILSEETRSDPRLSMGHVADSVSLAIEAPVPAPVVAGAPVDPAYVLGNLAAYRNDLNVILHKAVAGERRSRRGQHG